MRYIRNLAVVLCITLATPSCAAVMSFLPKVVSIVTDALLIIDQIQSHVDLYFRARPDADAQEKANAAIGKARAALNALNRTAQGVEAADDQRLAEAFDAFREAYAELLKVVAPFGVATANAGAFQVATAGTLYVPAPLAMRFEPR